MLVGEGVGECLEGGGLRVGVVGGGLGHENKGEFLEGGEGGL